MLPRPLTLVLLLVCAAGCGGGGVVAPLHVPPRGEARVWPPPPEPPRIRHLGAVTVHRRAGTEPTPWRRLRRLLLGRDDGALVGVARPFDVHVDPTGRLWVSSAAAGFVTVFDPASRTGRLLQPEGAAALQRPMGLGGLGALTLVADPGARRVVALDADGTLAGAWGGPGVLVNPVDAAASPDGQRVYVVDSYLHQLVVFDRDGRLLRRVGHDREAIDAKEARLREQILASPDHRPAEPRDHVPNRGAGPGAFRWPAFVACAPDGTVYVSDGMNFRIQAFDRDGAFVRAFGRHGDGPGSFARPKGVAVDAEGHVYVADAAFSNVQVFDAEGRLLLAFGSLGRGEAELWMPSGLAMDDAGRLHLADRYNGRVQVFEYLPAEPAAPRPAAGGGGERR